MRRGEFETVKIAYSCVVFVIKNEIFLIRAEGFIPAVLLPPWMAVVPRSSNVVAEPQLAVKTIHGCIVLTNALRRGC